jgi:anti-sigma factor RsiW
MSFVEDAMNRHWTDEDFLNSLYEIGPQDGHLDSCAECRARWEQWRQNRQAALAQPHVPAELLVRQRQQIESRLQRDGGRWVWMRWTPAIALAGVVVFAILSRLPVPPQVPPAEKQEVAVVSKSDAQLMADVYRSVYETEPGAVEAMQGLFEVKQ